MSGTKQSESLTVVLALLWRLRLLGEPRVQPRRRLGVVAAEGERERETEGVSGSVMDGEREATWQEARRSAESFQRRDEPPIGARR